MAQVSSEERVFSLLLALAASEYGLTKHELLSTVHGYSTHYTDSKQRSNVERQFERDKDAIRDLGIPIDTFEPDDEPGNNQLTRYRIQREQLRLPEDIQFSSRELTLLRLAAFAWRESTLAADVRLAQMKLSSFGEQLDTPLLGFAPRITAIETSLPPLQTAIELQRRVTFEYQKPDDKAAESRRVAPLALEKIDRRWHLIGWDFARDAVRVFLLARIVSPVKITTEPFSSELLTLVGSALVELNNVRLRNTATLRLQPHSEAEMRLSERMHYLDEKLFAEEIISFGAEVEVLAPESLRSRVVALLNEILLTHEAGAEETAS